MQRVALLPNHGGLPVSDEKKIDVRCLCLDVDGVLTDGRLFVDDSGRGARMFHVHDGFAIHWFLRLGGEVVICSGKKSDAVAARAAELGIKCVVLGSRDKLPDLRSIIDPLQISLEQVAVIGDDLPDLPLMRACGFPIAVANATPEVKSAAKMVTEFPGGYGAVREAVEYLLRESGRWSEVVEHYEEQARQGG